MKRILSLFLAALFLLSLPACAPSRPSEIALAEVTEELTVGSSASLRVLDGAGNEIGSDRVFWSTNDRRVATVTEDGLLTVRGVGFCEITVALKDDLSVRNTASVFCAYETAAPVEMKKERITEGTYASGELDALMKAAKDVGKSVVSSLTGKVSSLGIASMMLSFFSKDKYVFTLTEPRYAVTDGIVYEVTPWSSSECTVREEDVTAERVYRGLGDYMKTDQKFGRTVDGLTEAILAELAHTLPADGTYHFDRMNGDFEYRVVIRADFSTVRMVDYYSNGAITGLGITVQEIFEWSLESIADVNNNWLYEDVTNEVLGIENLRLVIECREKSAE